MAFDFLGTFNKSQFERLLAYAKSQLQTIDGRLLHIAAEQQRVGFLQFAYDAKGQPTGYSTGSPGVKTYIGKLLAAYEVLGGNPFYDLQVRAMSDPIYYLRGTHSATAKVLSNGEPVPQLGRADASSGNSVREIKRWMQDSLDRRSKIERKIRRALDYVDSLSEEAENLRLIRQGVEVEGSLLYLANQINNLISDPSYRAIADDKGQESETDWLKKLYHNSQPLSEYPDIPDHYPTPTHFIVYANGKEAEYPISFWNRSVTVPNGYKPYDTIMVIFVRETSSSKLYLSFAPLTVQA